jgi:hypothetical protein
MNKIEVIGMMFGGIGFAAIRAIYLDFNLISPNDTDLSFFVFIMGTILVFLSGMLIGAQNFKKMVSDSKCKPKY